MLKNLIAFDEQFKYYCERVVLSPDKIPSRPKTSVNVEGPNPKKRKVDSDFEQYPVDGHLAASIGRYALYYNSKDDNYKRCAVPLTPRLIATYRHGDNKMLKKDDEIIVSSWTDANFKVATRVVKILEEFDVIILISNVDVSDRNLLSNSIVPHKGMRYMMKVPHTSDNGRPASPVLGGRCLIVPLSSFEAMIQDLLPKEDSVDEAEWNN
ncbi:unnamed protein product [Auanema sp. JU1783]|nr:unnamed protein product [Auanema sp. JU1783]